MREHEQKIVTDLENKYGEIITPPGYVNIPKKHEFATISGSNRRAVLLAAARTRKLGKFWAQSKVNHILVARTFRDRFRLCFQSSIHEFHDYQITVNKIDRRKA